MKRNWKRILMGLLLVILIGQLAMFITPTYEPNGQEALADFDSLTSRMMVKAHVWTLIAMAVGGFVARTDFLIPAVVFAAVEMIYGSVSGVLLADNLLQEQELLDVSTDLGELLAFSMWLMLPHLLIYLAAAAVGSMAGMRIYRYVISRRTTASI